MSLLKGQAPALTLDYQRNDPMSLTVQLVAYNNPFPALLRTTRSVIMAAVEAQHQGIIDEFAIVLGDSSETPCLTSHEVEKLQSIISARSGEFGYFFFGENLGSAGGSNRLSKCTDSDLIFVLNPDTCLHPQTIALLIEGMDPTTAITEGRQLPLEHPKAYDLVTGNTSWASGACMLIRRTAFGAVFGFDDQHFFLHCDDVDLSWRLRIQGWNIRHVPPAIVFHDKKISRRGTPTAPEFERYYGALGRLMLCQRYGDSDRLDRVIERMQEVENPIHLKALRDFQYRQEQGTVPERLPERDRQAVATFVDGNFAPHRY